MEAATSTGATGNSSSPWEAHEAGAEPAAEHPEIIVGAALVGGFVLAKLIGLLGGDA
jgi:hypothetical protein